MWDGIGLRGWVKERVVWGKRRGDLEREFGMGMKLMMK